MKLSDAVCRKIVEGLRTQRSIGVDIENQTGCVSYAEIADALEERLEPTRDEVIAYFERVSNEMVDAGEYGEHRIYSHAVGMLRAYDNYCNPGQ